MDSTSIIRENLRTLASPEVREVAMSESVGGNAGPGCYVVNLGVDDEGRITYAGNDPRRTNAAIRYFASAFFRGTGRIGELILDIYSGAGETVKNRIACSAWLWNLYRQGSEKPILKKYLDGELDWPGLVELLRSKFPNLAPELDKEDTRRRTR